MTRQEISKAVQTYARRHGHYARTVRTVSALFYAAIDEWKNRRTKMVKSTDGFALGEKFNYQCYTPSGRKSKVVKVVVIEVRKFPMGTSSAIGEDESGNRFWLYADQRVW